MIKEKTDVSKAPTIVLKRKQQVSSEDESENESEDYQEDSVKNSHNLANMKKRDAVIRGEPIKVKRPGRPKMTETEKESAREKRKEDYKNAVPYDNETMKESRPDTTSAAKPVTENP